MNFDLHSSLMRNRTAFIYRQPFQNHLKQRTLFDDFLVTRKPTPAPTLAQPEDLRDEETEPPLSITEQTGASDLPEPSSAEHANDIIEVDSSLGVPSAQITDVSIGALAIFPPFLP